MSASETAMGDAASSPLIPEYLAGRLTVNIETAGQVLSMGRGAAYRAAARGEIPTLTFGGRKVVPVAKLLALVGIDPERWEAEPATGSATATVHALNATKKECDQHAPPHTA